MRITTITITSYLLSIWEFFIKKIAVRKRNRGDAVVEA
jgi:hypothetical protein